MNVFLRRTIPPVLTLSVLVMSHGASAQSAARAVGTFEEIKIDHNPTKDETSLKLQTGGNFNTGNTQSISINAAARLVIRRGVHQISIEGAANYGVTWNNPAPPYTLSALPLIRTTTPAAENFVLKARYDLFFTPTDAIFISPQIFRDRIAGFNSRVSLQIGYLRNWINVPDKRKFWSELGGDLNYENTDKPAPGQQTNERVIGSARLYMGFEEKSSRSFNFNVGIEGLLDLLRPTNFRMNGTVGVTSKLIDDALSIGFSLTGRFVNEPIPLQAPDVGIPLVERQRFDLTTLLTVVYTYTPPKPPPDPPAASTAPPATPRSP